MGLSAYGGALERIVNKYVSTGTGIIQLPCPELTYLGLKRWGMTREQYDTPYYRRHCNNILIPYVDQIQDYVCNNYIIEKIIGVDGSPSCGVNVTCLGYCGGMLSGQKAYTSQEVSEAGVFIRELSVMLKQRDITIPFDAINEKNPL